MSTMKNQNDRLGIIGSGGQADEAESYLTANRRPVTFRAVNKEYQGDDTVSIEDASEMYPDVPVVAAIGAPAVRRMLIEAWSGDMFQSIISEHAIVDESSRIAEGCIIAPRAVITTNVEVGRHSIVNVAATISHDSKLGDYVTISPGAHIGGNVMIGEGVFVGIGASIKNGIRIASGVVVGAGAVVIDDIDEPNSVYVGVPAKRLSSNEGWLSEI